MGYDVHITRKENRFDQQLVQGDPAMRLDGFAEASTGEGEWVGIKKAGLSVWTRYSQAAQDGNQAWFALYGGNVVVKNPDGEIRRKMYAIAQRLAAKVQGEEGECYGPDGNPIRQPMKKPSRSLFKRLGA